MIFVVISNHENLPYLQCKKIEFILQCALSSHPHFDPKNVFLSFEMSIFVKFKRLSVEI